MKLREGEWSQEVRIKSMLRMMIILVNQLRGEGSGEG